MKKEKKTIEEIKKLQDDIINLLDEPELKIYRDNLKKTRIAIEVQTELLKILKGEENENN